MPCYEFESIKPVVAKNSFVHPTAVIIGDVWIGENCYIGPLASLRGDFGRIRILNGSNVQDNCVLHGFPDHEIILEENSHIGHGAIIHTAVIRKDALIGMGAVVLDYSEVGERAIVAANSTVPTHTKVPPQTLFAGSPGEVKRKLSEENLSAKRSATLAYQELTQRCLKSIRETEPLEDDDLARKKIIWDIDFNASFQKNKNNEN